MARLIDANVLKDRFRYAVEYTEACVRWLIDDAPTIDAVEVVRCRDCKSASRIARDHTDKMRHCWNGRGSDAGDGFSRVSRDGFCDEGVRRATPEVET